MDVARAPLTRTRHPLRARTIDRGGARQPERFDPARAHLLGGSERERWLPYERIRALLDVPNGGTIIDFGAGTGTLAIPLALDSPGATIVALDEQPAMLERLVAASGAAPPANLVTTTGEGVVPACADRILVVNVLHEAGDAALVRMRELLGPGGFALVIDWRSDVARSVGPHASHAYTEEEARHRLADAGFEVRSRVEPDLPYHFVLEARHGDEEAVSNRREATLSRIRAVSGVRVTIGTATGAFTGVIDAGGLGESSVTVLLLEGPGADPARGLVLDLASVLSVREA